MSSSTAVPGAGSRSEPASTKAATACLRSTASASSASAGGRRILEPAPRITASGSHAITAAAVAASPKRNSAPASAAFLCWNAAVFATSARPGRLASRRAAPPGSALAEKTVTAWPRAAATQAASNPASPAPITATRLRASAGGGCQPALNRASQHGVLEATDGFACVNLAPAIVAISAGANVADPAGLCLAGPIGVPISAGG